MNKVKLHTSVIVKVPAVDRVHYRSGRIQIQIDADRYTSIEIPGWWSDENAGFRAAVKGQIAGAADLDPVPSLSPKPQSNSLYVPLDCQPSGIASGPGADLWTLSIPGGWSCPS